MFLKTSNPTLILLAGHCCSAEVTQLKCLTLQHLLLQPQQIPEDPDATKGEEKPEQTSQKSTFLGGKFFFFFYESSDPNYCCFYIVVFAEKPTTVQFTTDIALSESTAEGGYDFNKYF